MVPEISASAADAIQPDRSTSDQPAQQPPYAAEQALEQPEDAGQQAADDGSQTAEHAQVPSGWLA
jgi:hypothetical protein